MNYFSIPRGKRWRSTFIYVQWSLCLTQFPPQRSECGVCNFLCEMVACLHKKSMTSKALHFQTPPNPSFRLNQPPIPHYARFLVPTATCHTISSFISHVSHYNIFIRSVPLPEFSTHALYTYHETFPFSYFDWKPYHIFLLPLVSQIRRKQIREKKREKKEKQKKEK